MELEYELVGPKTGSPVLLIGGLGAQLVSWDDAFCDLLASRGCLVVRYDNRDSGLSTDLDDLGVPDLLGILLGGGRPPYTLDDLAADAIGLLDHLGLRRVHLVGLSMGGMIAQLVALEHPERVSTLVALLSGPPGRPAALPTPAVVEALLRPAGDTFEERVEAAVELRRVLAAGGTAFTVEDARARALIQIARAHRPAGTMRQAAAVLGTPSRLGDLARLRVPTMLVHGELDPLVAFDTARAAAAVIPGARFVPLSGVGHDLPEGVAVEILEEVLAFQAAPAPAG